MFDPDMFVFIVALLDLRCSPLCFLLIALHKTLACTPFDQLLYRLSCDDWLPSNLCTRPFFFFKTKKK